MLAGQQQRLDMIVGPVADTGFLVRRDVGRGHVERRLVEAQAAGIILAGGGSGRALRRVAIGAGHYGVHQIAAAFDRRLRKRPAGHGDSRNKSQHQTNHRSFPSSLGIESAVMISSPCDSANRALRNCPPQR